MTIHTCSTHGAVKHYVRKDTGTLRCSRCWMDYLTGIRVNAKKELVNLLGGECSRCGYSACAWSMHFHHRDPSTKEGAIAKMIANKQLKKAREEVLKCDLVCANCHGEIEFAKITESAGLEPAEEVYPVVT